MRSAVRARFRGWQQTRRGGARARCARAHPLASSTPVEDLFALKLRRATSLERVLIVADLVSPELALELPVIPRGPRHLRPVDGLALQDRLLVHAREQQVLLVERRLHADDLRLVREGAE